MDKEQAVIRGNRAKQLLEDELLKEAFADLEQRYINKWQSSPINDSELREKMWQGVNILKSVKRHLQTIMESGEITGKQLDRIGKKKKFKVI